MKGLYRAEAQDIKEWKGNNKTYNIVDRQLVEGFYLMEVVDNEDSMSFDHAHYIRIKYGDHYADIEVDPRTVKQYTTVDDKNGKKIFCGQRITALHCYEDDWHGYIEEGVEGVIEWVKACFMFCPSEGMPMMLCNPQLKDLEIK